MHGGSVEQEGMVCVRGGGVKGKVVPLHWERGISVVSTGDSYKSHT